MASARIRSASFISSRLFSGISRFVSLVITSFFLPVDDHHPVVSLVDGSRETG